MLSEIWTAAGVLLGFQVALFSMRLGREIAVGDEGRITWMPPADFLNLASMVITALGVYLLPLLGWLRIGMGARAFGLGLLLFVGYPFALAGHYEMFNRKKRSFAYCPRQEAIAVLVVLIFAGVFAALAFWIVPPGDVM